MIFSTGFLNFLPIVRAPFRKNFDFELNRFGVRDQKIRNMQFIRGLPIVFTKRLKKKYLMIK